MMTIPILGVNNMSLNFCPGCMPKRKGCGCNGECPCHGTRYLQFPEEFPLTFECPECDGNIIINLEDYETAKVQDVSYDATYTWCDHCEEEITVSWAHWK